MLEKCPVQNSRNMSGYFSMEDVLKWVTNDDLGLSNSDDSFDEGEGIDGYFGEP